MLGRSLTVPEIITTSAYHSPLLISPIVRCLFAISCLPRSRIPWSTLDQSWRSGDESGGDVMAPILARNQLASIFVGFSS